MLVLCSPCGGKSSLCWSWGLMLRSGRSCSGTTQEQDKQSLHFPLNRALITAHTLLAQHPVTTGLEIQAFC